MAVREELARMLTSGLPKQSQCGSAGEIDINQGGVGPLPYSIRHMPGESFKLWAVCVYPRFGGNPRSLRHDPDTAGAPVAALLSLVWRSARVHPFVGQMIRDCEEQQEVFS